MKSLKLSKKDARKYTLPAILLAIALIVVGGFLRVLFIQQGQIMEQNAQIKDLEAQIKVEQEKLADIKEEQGKVSTDEYIEGVARDKLGMTDPDEKVFIDVSGK